VDVAPEPVEVAGAIGAAGALVLDDRDPRQEGPEAAEGASRMVVDTTLDLAQEQVVRAERLAGEGDLGADLEGTRPASLEVPLEADVPDDALVAHRAISAERPVRDKLSELLGIAARRVAHALPW
jgi:hypothetical protein